MKKTLLTISFICASIIASAQAFSLTYPFSAITATTTGLIDPTTPPSAVGINSGSFTAVGTSTVSTASVGRFSYTGWPIGALSGTVSVNTYSTMTGNINLGEYYEVVITPTPGYTVTLNAIDFTAQRSGTGIRNYAVKTSADGYTSNLPASVITNTNLSIVGSNIFFWNLDAITSAQNGSHIDLFGATITSSVSFRFYGWNSEALSGTFSIDNVVISGSSSSVAPCASPTITSITSNGPICSNQPLLLQSAAITSTGTLTYAWTGTGTIVSTSVSNPTVTGAASGNYFLTVSNGCASTSTVISVVINPAPTLTVVATKTVICNGESVSLTASGATSYTWTNSITNGVAFTPTTSATYTVIASAGSCTNTAVKTISVSACTNIEEYDSKNIISILPNPNNGVFKIQSSVFPAKCFIIDITGKQIKNLIINESETSINISEFNNGVYYLNISNEHTSLNYKMIIAK